MVIEIESLFNSETIKILEQRTKIFIAIYQTNLFLTFKREGKRKSIEQTTNLGVFIRVTSFSYSLFMSKEELRSISGRKAGI